MKLVQFCDLSTRIHKILKLSHKKPASCKATCGDGRALRSNTCAKIRQNSLLKEPNFLGVFFDICSLKQFFPGSYILFYLMLSEEIRRKSNSNGVSWAILKQPKRFNDDLLETLRNTHGVTSCDTSFGLYKICWYGKRVPNVERTYHISLQVNVGLGRTQDNSCHPFILLLPIEKLLCLIHVSQIYLGDVS